MRIASGRIFAPGWVLPVLVVVAQCGAPQPAIARPGLASVTPWERPEPGDPHWWTDPANRSHGAAEVVAQALRVPLGSPWIDWRRRRESPAGDCVGFQGETGTDYGFLDDDEYWVYHCTGPQVAGTLECYAYLLGDSDEPTIERVRWTARPGPALDTNALVAAREAMLADLAARPELRRSVPSAPTRWSAPSLVEGWEMLATPLGHLRLGFARGDDDSGADSVLVLDLWSRALLAAETASDSAYSDEGRQKRFSRMPLPAGAQPALDARWPDLARALGRSPRSLEDLPAIRRSIESVRARDAKGGPGDRALVLFAATQWVWAFDDTSDTTVVRRIETSLAPVGMKGEWGHYDGAWHPSSAWLSEAIAAGESDPWSDRAFLYFQETGWEPNVLPDSVEQFQVVIDRGERFLEQHPRSTEWTAVALTVAQAHETAWSLAKASPRDEYVDWTLYAPAAPAHRARAIDLYAKILERWGARPPDARTRGDVHQRLVRLRLDVDTGMRKYFPTSC